MRKSFAQSARIFTMVILLFTSSFLSFSQQSAPVPPQAVGPVPGACMNGSGNNNSNSKYVPSPQNGSGSLGFTFHDEQCGLNYVQASRKMTTRYATPAGSGNPTTLAIAGLPACYQVDKAFVWANISYQGALPNPTLTIVNPALASSTIASTNAGTGPSKCWGETGCLTIRIDVTPAISGNGNYTLTFNGLTNPNWEIDGATLMIIYKNPAATYRGSITIADGCIVGLGTTVTQTLGNFTACSASTAANAFIIVSDMQSNVNANQHQSTLNNNTAFYVNNFYNFDVVNTNVTNGQNTSNFGTSGGGSDCFQWSMMGLYYQTTACVVCSNLALTLTQVNTPATCSQCNGSATVTATGGTAPYTYVWTPSGGNAATATGLCPGTYTCTVTDATGCLTSQIVVTITNTGSPFTITSTFVAPLCNGNCNGTATLTVTGGTAPYTYVWAPSGGNSVTGTGLCAGTYSCTVTDANGCTGTANVTLTQPTVVAATQSQTNVNCNGACNGTAAVVASGGTPGYTYAWAPSGGNAANATGLCAGNYTCTITDSHGCSITKTFTITQPTALTLTTSFVQATCNQSNGTASVVATGGTPGYTYNWAPSGGNTANATGLPSGSYTVTVTDANGCTATATVVIPNASGPAATLTAHVDVLCFGGNNGSATVNIVGGTNPITILWTPTGGNATTATGLTAGNYTCTVTDANGCSSTVTVTISQPTQLTVAVAGFNATCNGSCNGQAVCIPTGGTPNYTFSWAPSGGINPSATGLCAGIYTCFVTDQNGCLINDTAIVNQPPALATTTASTTSHCSQPDGTASVTVTGGTPAYTYAWSPSGGNTANATGLTPGTYTCTITDFNGCTVIATVVVPTTVGVTTSINGSTNATCFGNCDGTASANAVGGNGPYNYSWAPSGGLTSNATGLCAGTYTCYVTDAFGCPANTTVIITQPAQLVITPGPAVTICIGASTTLTATVTGGTPAYVITWAPSGPTVNPTVTTTYTVTATDANGCTSTPQTITVTVNPPLSVVASAPATICTGTSTTLTATASGGNGGPYTYVWTPGNMNGSSTSVSPTTTTTYTVSVTDACGTPAATATVVITVNPLPVITFTGTPLSGCAPLCVTFTNTTVNSSTCSWTFGDNTTGIGCPTITHCYPNPGAYGVSLTVTDINGCINSLTIPNMVNVYPLPDAEFTLSPQPTTILNPQICFTDGSSGGISWTWNFGDPADVLNNASNSQNPCHTYSDTGTYCVQLNIVNANGCTDSIIHCLVIGPDYTIYVPNAFTPNGDGNNETFFPKGSGIDETRYKMWIFDRWGNMIWYTEKWGKGWDGHANDGNDVAQEDTYVWKIQVYDYLGKKHEYLGSCSLIK